MSTKDIEARLDRSLDNQIAVPRLDRRFDAAVWSRIAAAEATATHPEPSAAEIERSARAARAARWLAISNGIGATVVVALLVYFGIKFFTGLDVKVDVPTVNVPMPQMSETLVAQIISVLGYVLGLATLVVGFSVTSAGRRVRAAFS